MTRKEQAVAKLKTLLIEVNQEAGEMGDSSAVGVAALYGNKPRLAKIKKLAAEVRKLGVTAEELDS